MIPGLILWIGVAVALFLGASALAMRSYNRFAARARGSHSTHLPVEGPQTPLDRLLQPQIEAHPGRNGLANLLGPKDAFASRSLSASHAGRSLDLIYYIWRADTSGRLLMADLLAAADRGVRVRLLLDDVNVQGFDLAFLGLTQHPNIEVRLFNPTRNRGHWLRRSAEFILGLSRFNRRMHGKIWIADGRLAILGGRNVGDLYFGASDKSGRLAHDADIILAGPLVAEAAALFDRFWNLGLSLPLVTLWPNLRLNPARFRRRLAQRTTAPFSQQYRDQAIAGRSADDLLCAPLRWIEEVSLLADPPEKAMGQRAEPWLADRSGDLLQSAQLEIRLTTPYFVPGSRGLSAITGLAERGVAVKLLTNSLSTTDVAGVHAAYAHYRQPLLASGAALWEFAPIRPRRRGLPAGIRGSRDRLHAKIFLIDGTCALVGSHNFDMRSAHLNTEFGLLFRDPVLGGELAALFDRQTAPDSAFAVTLENGALHWNIVEDGRKGKERNEPEASVLRRLAAWAMAFLPHDWL
jgi:putative cardiolipin synthase